MKRALCPIRALGTKRALGTFYLQWKMTGVPVYIAHHLKYVNTGLNV